LVGVLGSLSDIRVKLQYLKDGLRVALIVLLGNGGRVEELGPLRGKTKEFTSVGIETNVNRMAEVGRVADTAHARTARIDEVNPLIQIVVTLDLDLQSPGESIIITGVRGLAVQRTLDLEDRTSSLDSRNAQNILEDD
jgi:hypothetical protein